MSDRSCLVHGARAMGIEDTPPEGRGNHCDRCAGRGRTMHLGRLELVSGVGTDHAHWIGYAVTLDSEDGHRLSVASVGSIRI